MIAFLQVLIVLILLAAVMMAVTLFFKVGAGLSPLLTMVTLTTILLITSMLNGAFFTVLIFFAIAIFSAVYVVWRLIKTPKLMTEFYDLGFISFILTSLFLITILSVRQPLFYEWDEYSFWGTAARIVSESNLLYSVAENNMIGITHPPAFIMVSYLFNFIGEFEPFRTYIGYDVLMFSAFSAMISCFNRKQMHFGIASLAVLMCSPFIALNTFGRPIHLLPGFMSTYVDYPMAVLLAAMLLVYFCNTGGRFWSLLTVVFSLYVLTLSKEMGLAFALMGAGIIVVDLLFVDRTYKLIRRALISVGLMVTPIVAYMSWSIHLTLSAGVDRTEVGGEQNLSMLELPITGMTELLFPSLRSEKFIAVFSNLIDAFFSTSVTMFKSGFYNFLIITLLLLCAFLLTEERRYRISVVIFYVVSTLGCLVYNIFLGFTYVYVFKGDQGINLISYNRYVMTYYMAWFIFAFIFTAFVLRNKPFFQKLIQPVIVVAGCLIFVAVHVTTTANHNYLGYPESYYSANREFEQKVDQAKLHMEQDDVVFYLNSFDNGFGWFQSYYYFLPMHIDYSGGGYLAQFGPDGLPEYLIEIEADYVFVDYIDNELLIEYSHLFSDGLSGYTNNTTYVYSVEKVDDSVKMHPVDMS